ncbi:hypothetical protein FBU30_001702 [Linnemannia zychae]|nr:hypothetical protein FBU30_001702 [Linnemannia zychae]
MSQTNGQERQRHQERHTHLRTWTRTIPKETDRTNITPGTIKTIGPATSQTLAKSTGTFVTASSRASSPALSRTSSSLSSAPSITTSDYRQRNGEQVLITNTTNSVIERTSFLGSVWNLFRDVKDLASKEIDRLLEHFPYKNNTQTITTINQMNQQVQIVEYTARKLLFTMSF